LFSFSRLSFHPLKLECHLLRAAFISSLLICLPCANLLHLLACFVCMYVIIADARFRHIKSSPASIHLFPHILWHRTSHHRIIIPHSELVGLTDLLFIHGERGSCCIVTHNTNVIFIHLLAFVVELCLNCHANDIFSPSNRLGK
jgi:hypothetical protein